MFPDIQHYGSFIAAILIFQIVPGAGTIAILEATARQGARAGMGAVLGTLTGDLLYMLAAVLGLAAVMNAQPVVFQALQWFGAAYLCWLGIGLLRRPPPDPTAHTSRTVPTPAACFRRAFVVSLTNPKVMLFFVGFFPLFLRPEASTGTLAVMLLHVTMLSLAYQALLVLIGHAVARQFKGYPGASTWATRLAGWGLVGLSIRLAAGIR